jgi:hypothetical protein
MATPEQTHASAGPLAYTKTVFCQDDKSLTRHFVDLQEAINYANTLLAAGHQARLRDYRPPRKYVDILAERGRDG